jgi:ech hydrogenase subunit A
MLAILLIVVLVLPVASAAGCLIFRHENLRRGVVLSTGALLAAGALLLIPQTPVGLTIAAPGKLWLEGLILVADLGLLLLFLYYGRRFKSRPVLVLTAAQILLLGGLEWLSPQAGPDDTLILHLDSLALVMLLIVNLVGPLICCHATSYMRTHETDLNCKESAQPRFFFVMLLFMGAMNALVLANQLQHLYFLFEVTTLCSFLLIGHDRTPTAMAHAMRALWINSIGGTAFVLALVLIRVSAQSLDLHQLLSQGYPAAASLLPAMALLCLAAFVKSAQFPFQRWLLGAMIAPTPVSALLHASTMVKAGIYLVLRLAPLLQGTFLSRCTAVYGAFVFLAAAALAMGQRNGKKVLAYSTISNLGLIYACIGLNTPPALTAAVYLTLFHAVTKALLFLCVGTIEQRIHSRDIEAMWGLYTVMPATALMTVAGVLMMIMPPFGMLLGKWMAMESAATHIEVIMLVVPGSALTVLYWARWAGLLMSEPVTVPFRPESMPASTWTALLCLCAGGAGLSVAAPWLYDPVVRTAIAAGTLHPAYTVQWGIMESATGRFAVFPLCLLAGVGCLVSFLAFRHAGRGRPVPPYLCGEQTAEPCVFCGPMDQPATAGAGNYYLTSLFRERTLTVWLNFAAAVLLILLLGGAL